jgi:hypothetical protein
MSHSSIAIEDRLCTLLNEDEKPKPKYELWSQVAQGSIVGNRFDSVGYSFHQGCLPGWWYCVEKDHEHFELHEDDIVAQLAG